MSVGLAIIMLLVGSVAAYILSGPRIKTPSRASSRTTGSYVTRGGRSVPADEVFEAWTSGNINRMLDAAQLFTNVVDRHHLLNTLVSEAYKARFDPSMARIVDEYSQVYLAELPHIWPKLRREWKGITPTIPIFRDYASFLTERGEFDKAAKLCRQAIDLDLHDGTKGGFSARLARILKKSAQAQPAENRSVRH